MSEQKIDKIKQSLYEPLPDEAIKQHPTKDYLNTINAIYVTDRLNDVFGLDGWTFKAEIVDVREVGPKIMVVVKVLLICQDIRREQFGGNDNVDLGDAYKGAVTDALTKCASMIGVGVGVWKNEYKKGVLKQSYSNKGGQKGYQSKPATEKQIYKIGKMCDEVGANHDEYITDDMTMTDASDRIEKLDNILQDLASNGGEIQQSKDNNNEGLPF